MSNSSSEDQIQIEADAETGVWARAGQFDMAGK